MSVAMPVLSSLKPEGPEAAQVEVQEPGAVLAEALGQEAALVAALSAVMPEQQEAEQMAQEIPHPGLEGRCRCHPPILVRPRQAQFRTLLRLRREAPE